MKDEIDTYAGSYRAIADEGSTRRRALAG